MSASGSHWHRNDSQSFVGELVDFFDRVNEEDRIVVEALYQGTGAPLARPGRLSWLEREIHDFIRYLDRNLSHEQATARESLRVRAKAG
jgi:choline monooxygenase